MMHYDRKMPRSLISRERCDRKNWYVMVSDRIQSYNDNIQRARLLMGKKKRRNLTCVFASIWKSHRYNSLTTYYLFTLGATKKHFKFLFFSRHRDKRVKCCLSRFLHPLSVSLFLLEQHVGNINLYTKRLDIRTTHTNTHSHPIP